MAKGDLELKSLLPASTSSRMPGSQSWATTPALMQGWVGAEGLVCTELAPGQGKPHLNPQAISYLQESSSEKYQCCRHWGEGGGKREAGEMAQWLRALTDLPEIMSSIPSNHMVAHDHL